LTFTEKTIDWVTASLRHIGFTASSFSKLDPSVEGYQNLAGIEFEASCSHDSYNGKEKENWQILRGKTQVKAPEKAKLRELDAKFGSVLRGTPVNTAALPPSPPLQPAVAGASSNGKPADVPF
jgi:hypothetical protein